MPKNSFLTDIQTLRKRARQLDEGAVTAGALVAFPGAAEGKGRSPRAK
jgi:hypothetical protein